MQRKGLGLEAKTDPFKQTAIGWHKWIVALLCDYIPSMNITDHDVKSCCNVHTNMISLSKTQFPTWKFPIGLVASAETQLADGT